MGTTIGCTVLGSAAQVSCGGVINGSNVLLDLRLYSSGEFSLHGHRYHRDDSCGDQFDDDRNPELIGCMLQAIEIGCPSVPGNSGPVTFTRQ